MHNRVLFRISPPDIPQVLEHCVHGVQGLHSPSRGIAKKRQKTLIILSMSVFNGLQLYEKKNGISCFQIVVIDLIYNQKILTKNII